MDTKFLSLFKPIVETIEGLFSEIKNRNKKKFDEIIDKHAKELDKILTSYYKSYSKFGLNIANSKNKAEIIKYLKTLKNERDNIIMDRGRLTSILRGYRSIIHKTDISNQATRDFYFYLSSIERFFHSSTEADTRGLAGSVVRNDAIPGLVSGAIFTNSIVEITITVRIYGFKTAKEYALRMIDRNKEVMEHYHKTAWFYYTEFCTNKDDLYHIFEKSVPIERLGYLNSK